jgi:small subunit ribosomal protein S21
MLHNQLHIESACHSRPAEVLRQSTKTNARDGDRSARNRRKLVLQIYVRDNNVEQALRVLKKRMQREGLFREMKRKRFYEKPSERVARERSEAIRRIRKLKRKQAQREGLLPMPKRKPITRGNAGRDSRSAPRR